MKRTTVLLGGGVILLGVAVVGVWLNTRPLPFAGPYTGTVTDATTSQPIAHATVTAHWTCHDNPLPDGPGHNPVSATTATDRNGAFTLASPRRRGGWFGTDFHLAVAAPGYIDAICIVDPHGTPLPPSTVAWPFATTTTQASLPATLHLQLKPEGPVLQQALQSADPVVREIASKRLSGIR
jgi:hypothetical protein